jgi:hypothetical protein
MFSILNNSLDCRFGLLEILRALYGGGMGRL